MRSLSRFIASLAARCFSQKRTPAFWSNCWATVRSLALPPCGLNRFAWRSPCVMSQIRLDLRFVQISARPPSQCTSNRSIFAAGPSPIWTRRLSWDRYDALVTVRRRGTSPTHATTVAPSPKSPGARLPGTRLCKRNSAHLPCGTSLRSRRTPSPWSTIAISIAPSLS